MGREQCGVACLHGGVCDAVATRCAEYYAWTREPRPWTLRGWGDEADIRDPAPRWFDLAQTRTKSIPTAWSNPFVYF